MNYQINFKTMPYGFLASLKCLDTGHETVIDVPDYEMLWKHLRFCVDAHERSMAEKRSRERFVCQITSFSEEERKQKVAYVPATGDPITPEELAQKLD